MKFDTKNKKLPLKSYYPPAIITVKNKSYLTINDGKTTKWVEVPFGYNLDDIYKEFEFVSIAPVIDSLYSKFIEKHKIVKSKSGKGEYKVSYKKYENGNIIFQCSCPGATFRGNCKHINEYKKELNIT